MNSIKDIFAYRYKQSMREPVLVNIMDAFSKLSKIVTSTVVAEGTNPSETVF